jgi:TolA-binding protein
VAISHRSVLQLSADLEQSLALENPSAWSAPRLEHPSPRSKPTSEHEVAEEQLLVESPLPSPSRPSETKPVSTGPNNNASCFTPSHNAQASNNVEELAQRILGEVGGRIIEELSEKIDKLSAEVNRLQQENRAMKIEQNDNLSNALEKIGEYQNSLQRVYRPSAIAIFIPDAFSQRAEVPRCSPAGEIGALHQNHKSGEQGQLTTNFGRHLE